MTKKYRLRLHWTQDSLEKPSSCHCDRCEACLPTGRQSIPPYMPRPNGLLRRCAPRIDEYEEGLEQGRLEGASKLAELIKTGLPIDDALVRVQSELKIAVQHEFISKLFNKAYRMCGYAFIFPCKTKPFFCGCFDIYVTFGQA